MCRGLAGPGQSFQCIDTATYEHMPSECLSCLFYFYFEFLYIAGLHKLDPGVTVEWSVLISLSRKEWTVRPLCRIWSPGNLIEKIQIYQSGLSAFLLLQAKVGGPSFGPMSHLAHYPYYQCWITEWILPQERQHETCTNFKKAPFGRGLKYMHTCHLSIIISWVNHFGIKDYLGFYYLSTIGQSMESNWFLGESISFNGFQNLNNQIG